MTTDLLHRIGLIRMSGRDPRQSHRVASPLELFFDLVFVVAVSQASQSLHHGIAEGHAAETTLSYAMVFFAIWWAWMNFTWFASAFDTDDWLYRVTTIAQMAGVLVLAAGVHDAMAEGDWATVTWGYVIMRLALVTQWLRLALCDPENRSIALRYAAGIAIVQVLWLARLPLDGPAQFWTFWVMVALELLVPVWAERKRRTPWHPHHIAERFSLFTLILLGESLLASANSIIGARNGEARVDGLIGLAVAGIVTAAALWWVYFSRAQGERLTRNSRGFAFGYAHYLIFAAIGAVSAGIEVELDLLTGEAEHLTVATASLAFTIPVAVYMVMAWAVLLRGQVSGAASAIFLVCAGGVLLCAIAPVFTVAGTAVLLCVAVAVMERERARARSLSDLETARHDG